MYKNINLFIVLILLVDKMVYGQNFIPGPRTGQAAVLIGNRIYYTGGEEFAPLSKSKFFYYELDKMWVDLTSQVVDFPLIKSFHAADIGGVNQDLIFMIGGVREEQSVVHQFDTKTNTLTKPIIQGKIPSGRRFVNSVSYKVKIYVFSGTAAGTIYNGFDILDTTYNIISSLQKLQELSQKLS